jgi:hypothetical protein
VSAWIGPLYEVIKHVTGGNRFTTWFGLGLVVVFIERYQPNHAASILSSRGPVTYCLCEDLV